MQSRQLGAHTLVALRGRLQLGAQSVVLQRNILEFPLRLTVCLGQLAGMIAQGAKLCTESRRLLFFAGTLFLELRDLRLLCREQLLYGTLLSSQFSEAVIGTGCRKAGTRHLQLASPTKVVSTKSDGNDQRCRNQD